MPFHAQPVIEGLQGKLQVGGGFQFQDGEAAGAITALADPASFFALPAGVLAAAAGAACKALFPWRPGPECSGRPQSVRRR